MGYKEPQTEPTVSSSDKVVSLLQEIQELNRDESIAEKIKLCLESVSKRDDFIRETLPEESELRKKVVRDTFSHPKYMSLTCMLSGHDVGELLKIFAEMIQAERILDIGMFTGYSTVSLAESSFCNQLISLEVSKALERFVKERIAGTPLERKIRIVQGLAINSLVTLKEEGLNFDLIFIDADKEGYLQYYNYIMDNGLLNPKGVILCDNILWGNDTFLDRKTGGGQAMNAFVEAVKDDKRVDQMIFPIRDGVMMIKPKVATATISSSSISESISD